MSYSCTLVRVALATLGGVSYSCVILGTRQPPHCGTQPINSSDGPCADCFRKNQTKDRPMELHETALHSVLSLCSCEVGIVPTMMYAK
ncbi:hypothetical protein EDD15DRAFT_2258378 [Pisolithus albus]|nr:hypothetical protein EDD15DRAFT_2258378 [Pisolithus albus]